MDNSYPPARRGAPIDDPYRWLENPASEETRTWLAGQNDLFARHAAQWPERDALASRIRQLLGAGDADTPELRGKKQFFARRAGSQEHAALFVAGNDGHERTLVDPVTLDPSGNTTLDAWQPDNEGTLLAYQLSTGGEEESELRVLDVATGQVVDGPIGRCRYAPVAWLPGGTAFYYVRRLAPSEVPAGEEQYHRRVYLHQVGTPAADDVPVFGAGRDKTSLYDVAVSMNGRWLIISASAGTSLCTDVWLAELGDLAVPDLRPVAEGLNALTTVRAGRDGRLYLLTDYKAPRGRLAVAGPEDPGPGSWRDLIGEDPEAVLDGYTILDGGLTRPVLLAIWSRHAVSEITVHDLETGAQTGHVPLPGFGTIGGLAERPEGGHEAWFAYTDYTTPTTIYRYDACTGTTDVWARPPGTVEMPPAESRQVTFPSADGTEVRMIIIGPADQAAEPRPAILYGYGGFGVSLTPAYSAPVLAWVEAGGVYAVAGLRGGDEEGEEWHRAAMLNGKQRTFDDFHAAASALISGGWTTPGQLAISGESNGGLVVGAAITQHPSLYAAAHCSAPLLDMARYELFGLGEAWNTEYGTARDPEQLAWLLSYSPYHHVREGTAYPAVLFTVFSNDTRVDPMHARKMCAALQHAATADPAAAPVLLRAEADAGHGARAVSRSVALSADTLAFLARHTGLRAAAD
jgi:prolyl oligopeptidase